MDLTDMTGNGPDVILTFDSDAEACLRTRTDVSFILSFNDIYEKVLQMLTCGGVIWQHVNLQKKQHGD